MILLLLPRCFLPLMHLKDCRFVHPYLSIDSVQFFSVSVVPLVLFFLSFSMSDLVARTGRHHQRYEAGCRLVAGCIPFRYRSLGYDRDTPEKIVEVLMINSTSGPGLLFPKGGWENDETVEEAAVREAIEEAGVRGVLKDLIGHYDFKSKTHQDEFCPDGLCRAAMFALFVNEELESWPEQYMRRRTWLTIPEAVESCRHPWMRDALVNGFLKWQGNNIG